MRIAIVLAALAASVVPSIDSYAQPSSAVMRADFSAGTGWIGTRYGTPPSYPRRTNTGFGGLTGGVYWTDHLKSELGVLWTGESRIFGFDPASPRGTYGQVADRHRSAVFSIGQIYQFGRNASFHPFVGGGVSIDREHMAREQILRESSTGRLVVPVTSVSDTSVRVRPFASVGFKAYFSERGFFRTDVTAAVGARVPQAVWRIALGADF